MSTKPDPTDLDCTAESRGRCAPRHKTVQVVDERDDRNLCEVVCEDCGAEGVAIVGTALGNAGDLLAVEGDMEARQ